MTLASLRGKVVLVHLWSAWPYEWPYEEADDLSEIVSLHKEYKNRGLVIISVLTPMFDETYVRKVILGNHIEHPIGIDIGGDSQRPKTWEAYTKIAQSSLYLIDRKGILIEVTRPSDLKSRIEKALGK